MDGMLLKNDSPTQFLTKFSGRTRKAESFTRSFENIFKNRQGNNKFIWPDYFFVHAQIN